MKLLDVKQNCVTTQSILQVQYKVVHFDTKVTIGGGEVIEVKHAVCAAFLSPNVSHRLTSL